MDREHEHHQNMPYYLLKKEKKKKENRRANQVKIFWDLSGGKVCQYLVL